MARCFFFASILVLSSGCAVDGIDTIFGNSGSGGDGSGGAGQQASNSTTQTTDVATSTDSVTATSVTATDAVTNVTATTAATTVTTGGGEGPTVFCNNQMCDAGDVCCFNKFTAGQDFCTSPGTCPADNLWAELACNGPDDCNGDECCGKYDPQQGWTGLSCKPSCGNDYVMCYGAPLTCDGGETCHPSQALGDGYGYCDGNN